jgi:hypothetical protein
MKLKPEYRPESNNFKRFYTQKDMAIIKHDVAVFNSRKNRGDYETTNHQTIVVCGCGMEGCFLHHNIGKKYADIV